MKSALAAMLLVLVPSTAVVSAESVRQSARQLPVAGRADVVVVGGTVAAVAAAVEAAGEDASVMLVAPRNYLGEDMAATLRLWLEEDETPGGPLTKRIFDGRRVTTPMRVKRALEAALLEAKVDFLLGCYPTDVLVDERGQPAGIAIANRAGRQAILAKVIIDATERAAVAKMAGAEHAPWAAGRQPCKRVVLGEQPSGADEPPLPPGVGPVRRISSGVTASGGEPQYCEFSLELDLGDGSPSAIAEAEQVARDLTYRDGQLRAAERITFTPTDTIRGCRSADAWQEQDSRAIDHFRPRDVDRLYVLSAADVPAAVAERLQRAGASESLGRAVGKEAAGQAAKVAMPAVARVKAVLAEPVPDGDVAETLAGLRPTGGGDGTVSSPPSSVPVLAKADVVVVGGGTTGACAAIAAARRGAGVLVVEFQEGLGGVGTLGLIGHPYHGRNQGFTEEVPFCDKEHNTEYKMEWFRRQIRQAGGQIWFGALGCGAFLAEGRVRGAVVATPLGRGVILADVVIDASGNGDVAVAAGAESVFGADGVDVALQGTGLPMRPLGAYYVNTDYLLVDESDLRDTWRALVGARLAGSGDEYDVGPFIQTRERRRVVGDHVLSYLDQIVGRTYPDSIVLSASDYDSHGYPSDLYFALIPHTEKTLVANHPAPGGTCYTPYRCLLPRGLEGILVTGLAISMDRDASAMVRMQIDMHNQGYAAGVAAAMAAERGCTPRQIDVRALKRHLVEIGNLPESVLSDRDSFPLPADEVAAAVRRLTEAGVARADACRALAVVLSQPEDARPMLKESLAASEGDAQLTYAKILGCLGDDAGVPPLVEVLNQVQAWDAKILQGKMAEYAHLPTPIDAVILALGYSGDRRAVRPIVEKLETLDAGVTLSHHRAVALALEQLADPAAAEPLARLLQKPGMRGHAMTGLEPLASKGAARPDRSEPLREIVLARALYHCGDHDGLGEAILNGYRGDLRGLFARHAAAVLGEEKRNAK
jgi:hypothetical protein